MSNRPHFLQYDIPEVRGAGGRSRPVIENPSDELWREGCVRLTLSCWLVMESDIPYLAVNRMRRAGCRVYCVPFDASATDELKTMALENIRREIAEMLASAEQTAREANERLDDESDSDFRARRRRYLSVASQIRRRVSEMLRRVGPAAERFGITSDMIGIGGAATTIEMLNANMKTRAAAFANAHGILVRKGNEGNDEAKQVRRAVRSGEMPPSVAADWLRDNDEWEAGEALGDAFAGSSF